MRRCVRSHAIPGRAARDGRRRSPTPACRRSSGVSLDLRAGEVHALVGENGAGKSTLIKIITGAVQPDAGTIELTGEPVAATDAAAGAGARHRRDLPAARAVPRPDRGREHRARPRARRPVAARRTGGRGTRARRSCWRAIGARIDPEREAGDLSMPEQQLVEIARALGADARVLIMDEPTASLSTGGCGQPLPRHPRAARARASGSSTSRTGSRSCRRSPTA